MKMNNISLVFFAATAFQFNSAYAENNVASFHSSVEMLGSSHLHYDPMFLEQLDGVEMRIERDPPRNHLVTLTISISQNSNNGNRREDTG